MISRKAKGPTDRRDDRGPRERFGRRLDTLDIAQERERQARRLVDELEANGAELRYRAAAGDQLPSFTYEMRNGGDRQRCRSLIAEAKAEPMLWATVLREIAARSRGAS